jgi:hypothetical protein
MPIKAVQAAARKISDALEPCLRQRTPDLAHERPFHDLASATPSRRAREDSFGGDDRRTTLGLDTIMIRKLKSGGYRLYSRKINPKTGRRYNLGTFATRAEAEKHERAVQYFKRR